MLGDKGKHPRRIDYEEIVFDIEHLVLFGWRSSYSTGDILHSNGKWRRKLLYS